MIFRYIVAVCLVVTFSWSGSVSTAETAKEFYEGKTIRWIIPYRPGGGYDEYSRLIEPFFEKYTGAKIDLVNMPGTGSLKGSIEVFRAPSDGLHLGLLNGSTLVTNSIADGADTNFDLRRFSYIGQVASEEIVLVLSAKSRFSNLEDLAEPGNPLIVGATGRKGSSYVDAAMLGEIFDINTKIVSGFDSSADIRLALLRGDIDASWNSYGTQMKLVRDGAATAVMRSGEGPMEGLEGLPSVHDYLPDNNPSTEALMQAWLALSTTGRFVMGPPDIPQERLDFLETALRLTLLDPDFQNKIEASGRTLSILGSDEIRAKTVRAVETDPAVLTTLREALTGK